MFLAIIDAHECEADYRLSSARYIKAHGHGVHMNGHPLTEEERHIKYAYHAADRADSIVWALFDVLGLSSEEREATRKATRAFKRLCVRLDWQRFPKPETVEALIRFIES